MKILLLCLLFASGLPLVAQRTETDEAAIVLKSCGPPRSDRHIKSSRQGFDGERFITYRDKLFTFSRRKGERWHLNSGFIQSDGKIYPADRDYALNAIDCLSPLRQAKANPSSVQSLAAATAIQNDHDNHPVIWMIAVALIIWAAFRIKKGWDFARRPERLCLACLTIRQPLAVGRWGWNCVACNAPNPVPLNSPAAVEHLSRQRR